MIKILNSSLQRQFIIKKVDTASRYEELNGENTLDFKAVLDNKLANYFTDNSILELDNEYFDIAYSKKEHNHDNTQTLEVECEHVSYRLNNPVYDNETFVQTGTPSYILGRILSGTGLTVGSVSYGGTITYSVLEKTSRRQLLMGFVNMLGGEVQFDKFSVSILSKRGSRDVQLYTTGKNVDIVSKVVNKRELDTSGNHLVSYVCESILLKNKTVGVGDDILLVQPGLGIRESLRVVSYSYNPYEKYSTQLQITNFVHGIEDEMYRIESSTVAKDNIYNGVRIGPNDGFVAEGRVAGTDEIRSKTIMNATEGISIYSNTGLDGALERNFFVDLDGRIKGRELDISGDATFEGSIYASSFTGGSIDIGNGNFTVDRWGDMVAYNAYFEGNIVGSDISGGTIDIGLGTFTVDRWGNLYAESGTFKGTISGGSITSDTTIDVTTDVTIGRNLYLNAGTFNQGIFFNTFSETSITVHDPSSGLYVRGGLYTPEGRVATMSDIPDIPDISGLQSALINHMNYIMDTHIKQFHQ